MDGLVEAFAAIADGLRQREHVRIAGEGGDYRIMRNGQAGERFQVIQEENGSHIEPANVAVSLRGRAIDVVVPAEQFLVRALDPLPADSRPYLADIVRHQLDRLIPWRAEDVAHSYRIDGEVGDKLVVTIAATSRALHARLLMALRSIAPGELRLVSDAPQFGDETITIPVDGGSAPVRVARLRNAIPRGLAIFALVIVIAIAGTAYRWQQADAALAAAVDALAEQRRNAPASVQGAAGDRDFDAVIQRRKATPYAVLALDQLSIALPDDTWLTEFRIGEGRLRITGMSRNVPALVPVIEASPGFTEATFFAPTTRLQNGRGDRFHLETKLTPVERKP